MGDYDIEIEIDYYGDELDAVFFKNDLIYIYPLEEVEDIVNRLRDAGVEVIDKTVYSQVEQKTKEQAEADWPDYQRF